MGKKLLRIFIICNKYVHSSMVSINALKNVSTYLENLSRHMEAIRVAANNLRIDHEVFKTNEPLDRALGSYLNRRVGGGVGGLMR